MIAEAACPRLATADEYRFKTWADIYGPIFSLKIGPTSVVVLCDRRAINNLLDKKGSIYSDRPFNYVSNYVTHGDHLTLEPQGAAWREKRMVVTRNLNPKILDEKHWKIQEAEYFISSFFVAFRTD
jgi:hypothetical protein